MRILLPIDQLTGTGGAEMSVLQLSRELARRGHELDVLFSANGPLVGDYRSFSRTVRQARMTYRKSHLAADLVGNAPSAWAGIRDRPDVVYVNRFTSVPFAALVGSLVRAPVVCHLRDAFDYAHVRSRGRLVTRYVSVSAAVREHWIRLGLNPSRIAVVHTGIDLEEYPPAGGDERATARRELELPSEVFIALYCGRIDTEKGVDVLLEGWRRLDLTPEAARLVLVGEPVLHPDGIGYLRHLQHLAPAGCHWLPMRRDVVTAMHAADVVVVPSLTEGLGRTAIEAMATGCPVIGSRVGGIPEVLDGPFARFLFEAGNAGALAESLRGLLDWHRQDPGLGQRCTDHVRERFTIQRMTDGVESVLADVGQGRRRRDDRMSQTERGRG